MTKVKNQSLGSINSSLDVASPCRALCKLGPQKICEGCFRSSAEISFWVTMDNGQKKEVIENAKKRETLFLNANKT